MNPVQMLRRMTPLAAPRFQYFVELFVNGDLNKALLRLALCRNPCLGIDLERAATRRCSKIESLQSDSNSAKSPSSGLQSYSLHPGSTFPMGFEFRTRTTLDV